MQSLHNCISLIKPPFLILSNPYLRPPAFYARPPQPPMPQPAPPAQPPANNRDNNTNQLYLLIKLAFVVYLFSQGASTTRIIALSVGAFFAFL